ncbi:IS1380 family transposase [Blastococcus sp. TF02-09]|uniref:IS1380 family transposase n=1 Tax=Blastococcus sp. TF02-09 TaxID=2250576 RepID=UPI000DE97B54|nr:IS1380 family transposase [Blastococcus sp. TF02-9]RBY77297.1 IS1380 family transposase [Blastococcus sp. TF02-9]
MKACHRVRPVFDDPNLVSTAGLVPVLRLAETAGLHEELAGLTVPSPNAAAKTVCVIGGMLAGADSIDGLDVLRHGGMPRLFSGVRAPSTLGTHLRAFTHGHVQQLDRAASVTLAGLAGRVPGLLAGGGAGGMVLLDIDDTVREVHGYAKQAAAFGYTGVRGLNAIVATTSTPIAAPVITAARLRRGNSASAAGVGQLAARAIGATRRAGALGQLLVRADSAFYGHALIGAVLAARSWFSVTARMDPKVRAAISGIAADAWTPIRYRQAVFDEQTGQWISDAEVAEVDFVAFTGRRKADHVPCRLVVRRVARLNPASVPAGQGELFTAWRYHAFITNSTLSTIDADVTHRGHAIVEQVIAELKAGPLAHLPSGSYAANAAWLACAVLAFNLARAAAVAAGITTARWATLRTKIIAVAARIAATGRRLVIHLPRDWPWAQAWRLLFDTATSPPAATTP